MPFESNPVANIPKFIIGAFIGVVGAYGLAFEENWNTLLNEVIGETYSKNQLIIGLVDVLPLITIFIGSALMLSARNKKQRGEAS